MSDEQKSTANRATFPVGVLMEQQRSSGVNRWSVPTWEAVAVIAGEHLAAAGDGGSPVRDGEGDPQRLWPGFEVTLFRDSADAYWYNLVGKHPSLFVICRAGETGDLEPFLVTANYDEAGAYMEADDTVYAVPIPPEIYRWLERFVIEHNVPQEPEKKRRRVKWAGDSAFERRPGGDPQRRH
jgi:hypothetical protein